ncbi:MAG TPA: FIST N-terminal domain-containing protein [Myxococcota bacterium]|nr:FIST N-terminal domain-containing protein [Myxococcota bacterium]
MVRTGAGSSNLPSAAKAAEAACHAALAAGGLDRAEAALLFAAGPVTGSSQEMMEAAVAALGTSAVIGASADGLVVPARPGGADEASGVAVLALSGLQAEPLLLAGLAGRERSAGPEILAVLGGSTTDRDLVLVLPDPLALDAAALVAGLRDSLGPAVLVGAGATPTRDGPPLAWCGDEVSPAAAAVLVLRAARPPRVRVTQSCHPASPLQTVTRAEGHWVLELDGRPALEAYREAALGPLAADLRRAASFLLVALPRRADASLAPGSYLVRHVVGFDGAREAFALPEPVAKGRRLSFVLRDAGAARQDLAALLEGVSPPQPAAAIYLDCCARGASLFGVAGLEAGYLERALPGVPLVGVLGACEIGPIGGVAELLTYTGVLALLDGDAAGE